MTENETTSKPTAGPWIYAPNDPTYRNGIGPYAVWTSKGPGYGTIALTKDAGLMPTNPAEQAANARLIADAGTVYHATGLTPSQLAEQRAELLVSLTTLVRHLTEGTVMVGIVAGMNFYESMKQARAAIARATDTPAN